MLHSNPSAANITRTGLTTLSSSPMQVFLGFAAVFTAVLIWSAYFLSLRQGALSPLGTLEITFFRYAVPALVLLPLAIKRWRILISPSPIWLLGITLGAGLPFFIISVIAMEHAPGDCQPTCPINRV